MRNSRRRRARHFSTEHVGFAIESGDDVRALAFGIAECLDGLDFVTIFVDFSDGVVVLWRALFGSGWGFGTASDGGPFGKRGFITRLTNYWAFGTAFGIDAIDQC